MDRVDLVGGDQHFERGDLIGEPRPGDFQLPKLVHFSRWPRRQSAVIAVASVPAWRRLASRDTPPGYRPLNFHGSVLQPQQICIIAITMKLALLMIIAVGLCVFGYLEARKKSTGEEQVAAITEVLNTTQQKLNTTESELAKAKTDLKDSTQRLAELEESKKKEIASLQTKIDEAAKKPTPTETDEGRKQMTEIETLRAKITAQETELSQAKTAASTALTEAAASKAEVQRLQQLQARPAISTALDRKK